MSVLPVTREHTAKHKYVVKYIKCDNAGVEMASKQERLGIHFAYTMQSTPQQNGRVE